MSKPFKTLWSWLRHRNGSAPQARSTPARIIAVRPVYPLQSQREQTLPQMSHPHPKRIDTTVPKTAPVEVVTGEPENQLNGQKTSSRPRSRHIDRQQLVIRPLRPDEPLDTNVETWERRGNSFLATEARTRVITGDRALVSPQQIAGFCNRCGQANHEFFTCARTGIPLCRACVTFFPHHAGPIPVCMEAARSLRLYLSGWDLHDLENGLTDDGALRRLFPFLGRNAAPTTDHADA